MKIVSLEVENVKRIKAVQITPTGELVVIGGRNAQGKSSCLDAIEMALAGKSAIPEEPIRRGSESARVVVTLDDGLVVERTFRGDNSYLVVKRGDGTKAGTPQALLDSLCSRIAFDPLAFMRAKPAEQANQLRGLVGLDFRAQDIARKNAYDHRTDVNRQVKQAEAAAQAMPIVEGAPAEEISVADLMAELKRRHAANADVDKAHANLDEHNRKLAGFQKQLTDAEFELASLKVRIENLTGTIAKGTAFIAAETTRVNALPRANMAEIEQRIADSETINANVRVNRRRAEILSDAAKIKATADELTRQIEAIDAAKSHAMATATWPVPGLGFSDTGVTFQGLPLEQASSAEQLRVSVAIGLAFNPKLKILLIRDGSLLDADSLAIVAKMASDAGGQVWLEVVGNRQDCAVVIEDGSAMP